MLMNGSVRLVQLYKLWLINRVIYLLDDSNILKLLVDQEN